MFKSIKKNDFIYIYLMKPLNQLTLSDSCKKILNKAKKKYPILIKLDMTNEIKIDNKNKKNFMKNYK